ncbi:MAG: hypothetical protein WCC95_18600 [Candidatus Sulfotelmatobacter sp.]
MKLLGKLLAAIFLLASCAFGQGGISRVVFNTPTSGTPTYTPGWQLVQDNISNTCTGTKTTCTYTVGWTVPVQASNSVIVIAAEFTATHNISSISGGGGGAVWTHCTACKNTSQYFIDIWYGTGLTVGTDASTVTVTFDSSASVLELNWAELLPPNGLTASFDTGNNAASASCNPCTTPSISVASGSTDAIYIYQDEAQAYANAFPVVSAAPYYMDMGGNPFALDVTGTSSTSISMAASGNYGAGAIAFKVAQTYGTNTPFTVTQFKQPNSGGSQNCAPTCAAITITSTAANSLIFVAVAAESNAHISSIADSASDTFTIPAGCQQNSTTTVYYISCGYRLASSSGVTTVTPTLNTTSTVVGVTAYVVTKPSGSFSTAVVAGTSGASYVSTGLVNGQSLSLSTGPYAIFQCTIAPGGVAAPSFYDIPFHAAVPGFLANAAACGYQANGYSVESIVWPYPGEASVNPGIFGIAFQ